MSSSDGATAIASSAEAAGPGAPGIGPRRSGRPGGLARGRTGRGLPGAAQGSGQGAARVPGVARARRPGTRGSAIRRIGCLAGWLRTIHGEEVLLAAALWAL